MPFPVPFIFDSGESSQFVLDDDDLLSFYLLESFVVVVMVSAWMSASRVCSCSSSRYALASACCIRWSAARSTTSSFVAVAESAALLAEVFDIST